MVQIPPHPQIKNHIIKSLSRYWNKNTKLIKNLPIPSQSISSIKLPLKLKEIKVPIWAQSVGINNTILVPAEIATDNNWKNIDWFLVLFVLLENLHEREIENIKTPIHSYSFLLKKWDKRIWDRAWVNRIAIFLRIWASKIHRTSSDDLFGKLPPAEILVTHDVDAIKKTFSIRIKQASFNLFKFLRHISNFELKKGLSCISNVSNFLFRRDDWNKIDEVLSIERKHGIKSIFNFYADKRSKNFKRWLIDPSYSLDDETIEKTVEKIILNGSELGIHPAFDSWQDQKLIADQKNHFEKKFNIKIVNCRQHWIRFSWFHTWKAQSQAGILLDTTLMFNDRPGFRNSSAIKWYPWNSNYKREEIILLHFQQFLWILILRLFIFGE